MESNKEKMVDEEIRELVALYEGRGWIYLYFSSIYYSHADQNIIDASNEVLPVFEALIQEVNDLEFANGVEQLKVILKDEEGTLLSKQNNEYTSLFSVPNTKLAPYESVYTSVDEILMSEAWDIVKNLYYQYNYTVPEEFKFPLDHISIELNFMSHLSNSVSSAFRNNDIELAQRYIDAILLFFNRHVNNWIPVLCADIIKREAGGHTLIGAVSKILKAYLIYDKLFLEEIIDS